MSDFGDAIDLLCARLLTATAKASVEGAAVVEGLAKADAPAVTGTLRRSIDITGPFPNGIARFETLVGPTVVYGRIRELGGVIRPQGHPYLTFLWSGSGNLPYVQDNGRTVNVWTREVTQAGRPYLKPAVEAAELKYRDICARRWGDAIKMSFGTRS